MEYRESLPEGCPPDEAEEIAAPIEVFRLVKTNPPTDKDFISLLAKNPKRKFPDTPECLARGISVFTQKQDVKDKASTLSHFKNRLICRVTLTAGAGKIQQTFQPSHHTWWPLAAFDILAHCDVESP